MPYDAYNISRIFSEIELSLIQSMMRNLSRHLADEAAEGFDWTQWQAVMLQNMQAFRRKNAALVDAYSKQIDMDIKEAMQRQYNEAQDKLEKDIKAAVEGGYTPKEEPQNDSFFGLNKHKFNALVNTTQNDLTDARHSALRLTDDVYRQTIFKAQMFANMGAATTRQAVDMAVKDYLNKGIDSVVYSDGRRVPIDVYAEMAIRTASQRAYLMGEGDTMNEYGERLAIIPAEGMGCPKCTPWFNKIVVNDVYAGGKAEDYDFKYPLLSTAISKGYGHPQCAQPPVPYFEGIDDPPEPFTEEEKKEAERKYSAEQRQRHNERQIRKYKRLEAGSLDPANQAKYGAKVKEWQAAQRAHIAENSFLRRDSSREQTRGLTSVPKSDILKSSNFEIGKSVGAKAKNYAVTGSDGTVYNFAEGTKVQNAEVFAGKGTKHLLHDGVADGLTSEFGGRPENWQHSKGVGVLSDNGEERKAEVHWFQESTVGKVKFKVKEWLDED